MTDTHVHTSFSFDGEALPDAVVECAVEKGLSVICITDHMDYDFGAPGECWTYDLQNYYRCLKRLSDQYSGRIALLIGMEFGMQPHLAKRFETLEKEIPFDYIIGSQHLVYGKDPYYPEVFEQYSDLEVFDRWFFEALANLRIFSGIDAFGHIDYCLRYGTLAEASLSYDAVSEKIEAILLELIAADTALELNSAGFSRVKCIPEFHKEVLLHYRSLGGSLVTIGSDAHHPKDLCRGFEQAIAQLKACGYSYYTYYENRSPKSVKIC